jgi:ER-bound oxygenase mpaB/B'/Rubber oxygenase, catalytic domain
MLWVHATLVESSLAAYNRLVRPLSPEEEERYYREMALPASLRLLVPAHRLLTGGAAAAAPACRVRPQLEPRAAALALAARSMRLAAAPLFLAAGRVSPPACTLPD